MKTLELVFTRIYYDFKQNKSVFTVFLIGCLLCSLSFIFFYGNQLSLKIYEGSDQEVLNEYTINFSEPASYEDIVNSPLIKSDIVLDVEIRCSLTMDEIPMKEMNLSEVAEFDDGSTIYTMSSILYGKDELLQEMGRVEFTDAERKEGKNVVILPSAVSEGVTYNIKTGDKITVSGREYEVVGMSTMFGNFYIPPETFKKGGYTVDSMEIVTSEHMSRSEINQFVADIQEAFPNGVIHHSPLEYFEIAEQNLSSEGFYIICEFIVVSLSFMFLMKYIIDSNNAENIIYSMVGATKKRIFAVIMLENTVIYGVVAAVACVLHKLLYNSFFNQINVSPGITYTLVDYVMIVLAVVVLSCIVSLPFVFSCLKNSIIKNKNKYS